MSATVPVSWRLLSALSEGDRDRVLSSARQRRFVAGEVLFHEGDPGSALHFLESGRVAVRVTTPDGQTATLSVVGPGEVFGEMALLRKSSTRTATAIALESSVTLSVERESFLRLCTEHPAVEHLLVGLLAARVDRLSNHLVEALYLSADKRVVRRLLELCRVYGPQSASGVVVRLTQEDLAGLAGTTRPTVNTVLRELQVAGLVALSRGRIEVLDVEALASASR